MDGEVNMGDPELEPAWDLICTPGTRNGAEGRRGEPKLEPSKIVLMAIQNRNRRSG